MPAHQGFPTGNLLGGKFRVVRTLGEGGMGVVYEVEHTLTHHRRALKVIAGGFADDATIVERFLREASAAGRIGSPHIVETFDAGRLEGGEPYLLMELVPGRTLADVIEERRRLPLGEACRLLAQACRGVAAAHDAGIVHRDLKPENLIVSGPEPGFVKVLDFGICKLSAEESTQNLTRAGAPIGTPSYMAPEQLRADAALDGRADIYALGVVFYECITGELPFTATPLAALAVAVHEGTYPAATERAPELPASVDAVVARALHREPSRRFATAHEFATALEHLATAPGALSSTEPRLDLTGVTLPRDPPVPVVVTSERRAKRWALLAGIAAFALFFGVLSWQLLGAGARREQDAAETDAVPSDARGQMNPTVSTPPPASVKPFHGVAPTPPPSGAATARVTEPNVTRGAPPSRGTALAPSAGVNRSPAEPRTRARDYDLVEENPF